MWAWVVCQSKIRIEVNLMKCFQSVYICLYICVCFRPDLFDWNSVVRQQSATQRLEHAFNIAKYQLGIEKLLDPEGWCISKLLLFLAQFKVYRLRLHIFTN